MNKNKINSFLRKFGVEIHGTGYLQSLAKKEFSQDAFEKQKELAGGASVIFDVGANFGDTVEKYASLFPGARIYGFEPFPDTFKGLEKKHGSRTGVFLENLAVSDFNGSTTFHVNHNVDTNSLLKSATIGLSSDKEVANITSIDVNVVTIDDYCKDKDVDKIDILKLDIQGGEFAALKGASGKLREKKIGLIYLESYFRQQYVDQPLFYDIGKLLFSFGYCLQDIYSPIYGKGSIAWCDAVFLPDVSNGI